MPYANGKELPDDFFLGKEEEQAAFGERGFHLVNNSVLIEVNAYELINKADERRNAVIVTDKTLNDYEYDPEKARRAAGIETSYIYDDFATALSDVADRIKSVYATAYPEMKGWEP